MHDPSIRIDKLRLRVPGLSAEEGRAFGEEIAHRLSACIIDRIKPQQIGELRLRVQIPAGTSRNQIAPAVSDLIIRALR